jgi:hypothetical protein
MKNSNTFIKLLVGACLLTKKIVYSHGVEVRHCVTTSGFLRIFVEHWHPPTNSSLLMGTMTIRDDTNGIGPEESLSPDGIATNIANSTTDLPGCLSGETIFDRTCNNQRRNWVYFDFAAAICNIEVKYTFLAGNTQYLEDGCSTSGMPDLYPITITDILVDVAGPVPYVNGARCDEVQQILSVTTSSLTSTTANVPFVLTAIDDCDPNPTLTSSHSSNDAFPLGNTTVTVNTLDNQGRSGQGTFIIQVQLPAGASMSPSLSPNPTLLPSTPPTKAPTASPTASPTKNPNPSPTKNPTASPTRTPNASPTKNPTPSPTKNPTPSPTKNPTSSPISKGPTICTDTKGKFMVDILQKKKSCKWARRKHTEDRCGISLVVQEMCPVTCDTCYATCTDVSGKFMVGYNKRSCKWVRREATEARCNDAVVQVKCPITCDSCDGSPIRSPVEAPVLPPVSKPSNCKDATKQFNVGNDRRTCRWVRKDTESRCNNAIISRQCPVTCDSCPVDCKDATKQFNVGNARRTCKWVRKDTESRCNNAIISRQCPVTCNTC